MKRKLPYIIALAVVAGITFFIFRGPHISNALKKMVLPELEMATGKSVVARTIYINIFPLFIEAKDIKMFDENGERLLRSKRVKAYISLSGLLNRDLVIRRLVIKEPKITAERKQLEEIADNIRAYIAKKREARLNVTVKVVEIQDGAVNLNDENSKAVTSLEGLRGEIIIGKEKRITAHAEKIQVKKEGWPEITGDALVNLTLKGKAVLINRFFIGSLGSKLKAEGEYQDEKGSFKFNLDLLAMTLKKILGLARSGEGELTAAGGLIYEKKGISVDLKVSGSFYLQTLMELLSVKDRVEGLVDVKGEIKGPLNDIKATGSAVLHKGDLYNVDIDYLKSTVSYEKGTMKFFNASGKLYNGSATASASIQLPVVNSFTLNIDFTNIDSLPLFKLIGWDPGINPGKAAGSLSSAGAEFDPAGWFEYKSIKQGRDALGRVSIAKGGFEKHGAVLLLQDIKVNTGKSELNVNGDLDIHAETLNLKSSVKTEDVRDLSSPYYEKLKGRGQFEGWIRGPFKDPLLAGEIKIFKPVLNGYASDMLAADIKYKKESLEIKGLRLSAKEQLHKLDGSVYFKKAKTLFDLTGPEFKLSASLNNADLENFARIFYADFTGKGRLNADMKISGTGENPKVYGKGAVEKADLYNIAFDSASFNISYGSRKLDFLNMKLLRGKSAVLADASIDHDGKFSYKATSGKLLLSDIIRMQIQGDAVFSVKSEGHGTFDNPSINLEARMTGGTLKGKNVGGGVIKASIKEKNFTIDANVINEKVKIKAGGRIDGERPWNAKVDVQSGRYDFLINPFLKDVPEDLILSLNGNVLMHGDRHNIIAKASIKHIALSMYGYSFTNEEAINLDLNNRKLDLNSFSMRSGNTSLNISGDMIIGKTYNIALEGSSSLAPFKSLSAKIGLLKGDAECIIAIKGAWDSPEFYGGLNLTNGAFGLKDYYYRISSLSGYIYMDNDRIVLQELSGKMGGGDIVMTGVVYLKKFAFKRFYVEARLNNITTSVSNDFNFSFGGNILYKGTPESQMLSGDIKIARARYKERTEWKSWLLKTKKAEVQKAETSSFEKAALNIRVIGKENIFIDNNVARATMSADMVLRGTINRPVLLGRLESKEGKVFFRNNEFNILYASADFSDLSRINPVIDIAAETFVKSYKIKMDLEGRLDRFNMTLSSDPPLKEMDILSLLTVGRITGDIKGLEGGIGAGEATSFVTGKVQDVVEERLKNITGFDRFQIDPYVSKITGTVEPRVTVSRRLMGDKIFVTYATAIGTKEEQIIKLEYFMNKNVSLIGVRDERGIVGGDVKFRFEFK